MDLTVCESIEKFLFHCQYEKHLNPKTLKAYQCDLDQFSQFVSSLHQFIDITEIGKEVIKEYLKQICQLKPKTFKRKVATIKAMFNFLEFDDVLAINPFRKLRIKINDPLILPVVMTLN